jgi:hypothetical protein
MEIPTDSTDNKDNNILSQWRLKLQNEGISAKLFVMRASSQSRLDRQNDRLQLLWRSGVEPVNVAESCSLDYSQSEICSSLL